MFSRFMFAFSNFQMLTMRQPELGGGSNARSAVEDKSGPVTAHGSHHPLIIQNQMGAALQIVIQILILKEK